MVHAPTLRLRMCRLPRRTSGRIRDTFFAATRASTFPRNELQRFLRLPFVFLGAPKFKRTRKPRAKAADFDCRSISRYAQIDLVFASSRQKDQTSASRSP